jgi:hypothetical protein
MEEQTYKEIHPLILSDILDNMIFTKNHMLVIQTPPDGYAYVPNYISAGPQTHFGIYKKKNDKLELIHQALLFVYDGCSAYLIEKNIDIILQKNNLSKTNIENIRKYKYEYITNI